MGTVVDKSDEVIAVLANQMRLIGMDYAQKWLAASNRVIEANEGHTNLALGAGEDEMDLVASGYIATASKSGYEDAKTAASFGRDASRGLWADPVVVPNRIDGFSIMIAYALSRATLMHEGYTDYREKVGYMYGTEFLAGRANELFDGYVAAVGDAMKMMEIVAVPTRQEARRELEQRAFDKFIGQDVRDSMANERDLYDQFLADQGKDVLQRQRNANDVKGYRSERVARPGLGRTKAGRVRYENTGRLVPVYRRETAGERDQRVEELYNEWKLTRIAAGRSGGF